MTDDRLPSGAALLLDGVSKSYGAVRALSSVDLSVDAGEVHAVVGENGAGKSTLMGVAAGSVLPDEGQVHISGQMLGGADPLEARRLGLGIVYQHPALLPDLTVAENLILAARPGDRPGFRNVHWWAADRLQAVGLATHPAEPVRNLTLAQRHLLEIAKALALEPRVLVLDEPTEPFNFDEVDRLFEMIERLREEGTAVVYISHRLPEVLRIADRVSVLRDGEIQGTFPNEGLSESELVHLVVGRPVEAAFPSKAPSREAPPGTPDAPGRPGSPADAGTDELVTIEPALAGAGEDAVLSVRGLGGAGFAPFDLDVYPGEVVGLAGIEGNGQRDIIRALAGLLPSTGHVSVRGRRVRTGDPSRARRAGILFIADDRQVEGLFKTISIRENLAVSWLGNGSAGVLTKHREEAALIQDQIASLGIKLGSAADGVDTLSGGNQQKVCFGRALMAEPDVLLVDEPTHGVDAGARMEIYRIMRHLASEEGTAVVMLSSDAIELEGMCDRVLVLSRGQVIRELSGDRVTEQGIAEAMLTATRAATDDAVDQAAAGESVPAGRWSGLFRRIFAGDQLPAAVLAVLALVFAAYTSNESDTFLTEHNARSTLVFAAVLVFVSLGQQLALLVGSIDLSVASTVSMSVVTASFLLGTDTPGGLLPLAFLALVALALAIGLVNAGLIRFLKIPPVVATIVSFFLLSGLALWLRPTAGGPISRDVTSTILTSWGPVPVAFVVAVAVAAVMELWSRHTAAGMALRAIGSDQVAAVRLGVRERSGFFAAHVGCSLLALAAAVVLMARTGVGDPASGSDLTLNSIAVAFVAGASIRGGRGSFVAVLAGAVLLQLIVSSLPFLELDDEWQFWLVGAVTIAGAGAFAQLRARSVRRV